MPSKQRSLAVDWRREYDLFVGTGRMLPKTLQKGSDATFSLGSFSDALAIRRGYDDKERNKHHAGISAYVSKHVHEARADGLRKMKHGPWCYDRFPGSGKIEGWHLIRHGRGSQRTGYVRHDEASLEYEYELERFHKDEQAALELGEELVRKAEEKKRSQTKATGP